MKKVLSHIIIPNGQTPSLLRGLIPIATLLAIIAVALITRGSDFVASYSWTFLLVTAAVALLAGFSFSRSGVAALRDGMLRSARQTMPAIPMLLLIGTVSATWMLCGVVPLFIEYGLGYIHPHLFLLTTCCICAFISVLTGSSWTTIATLGVAFMGIGSAMGYSPGWTAGAIISGAYFGDKISPLSDTTVLAASSTGVDLFKHIRYMLITTIPSLIISLAVFLIAGYMHQGNSAASASHITEALSATFMPNPWILLIPALTFILILCRLNTLLTLTFSTLAGLAGVFIFQPQLVNQLIYEGQESLGFISAITHILFDYTFIATPEPSINDLISTGGMRGMLPTVLLVLSAMCFGGIMMGTGLLGAITQSFTRLIRNRVSAVGSTAATGLLLNIATADQYLSIIIGGNMYKHLYTRIGLEPRLLSRTVEDSVSVTSVLIPWNSCGVTQSSVLGVATLTYLPYCVFNYISPLMSLAIAITGFKIKTSLHPQARIQFSE